jgi:hypothetical protein
MFMQPYVTLKKVTSIKNTINGNECFSVVLTHQRAFSNMFGITDEDLKKGCYRFLVKNPFEVFQATYDGVDMVYTYNADKNEYVPVCSCEELKTNDELAEKLKHYLTLNETFGNTTDILEKSFENPCDVDLLIKQGDNEIVCGAIPFCCPAGRFLVPVRADNENGFVLADVPYEYSFYRTTYNDKASYVVVPKNTPIFFENTFYSDCQCLEHFSNQHLTAKFFKSNIERSYNSLGEFMKDKQVVEICKNNALDKLTLIDPKAKDTKVFMIGEV